MKISAGPKRRGASGGAATRTESRSETRESGERRKEKEGKLKKS